MKNILRILRFERLIGCKSVDFDDPNRPTADRPVVKVVDGRLLRESDMQELDYLQLMGAYHHEQLEAFAARACKVIGIDPDAESVERDWCNEIVLHGQEPKCVINQINKLRLRDRDEVAS